MRAIGVALYSCVLLVAPSSVSATSYVPVADRDLAAQAPVIAQVRIVEVVAGAGPFTDYRAQLEDLIQGTAAGSVLTVRVPGGSGPDGVALTVFGAPRFQPGERALLFLAPRPDGVYGLVQLMLGAFHEVRQGGEILALRDLSQARPVALSGSRPDPEGEPARDFDRFAAWLRDRALGVEGEPDYLLARPPGELPQRGEKFSFLGNVEQRWFTFDGGGSVAWYASADGQQGLPGGGFAEVQAALAAWNDDPDSTIRYSYGGTTTASSGFVRSDGRNSILFNDPNQEVNGTFSCATGGVLAIGGVWGGGGSGSHRGRTWRRVEEGDIVVNDGTGCFLSQFGRKNAEEVFGHELGHTLGLGHTVSAGALMRATAYGDGRGAQLAGDDLAAARCLYGDGATCGAGAGGGSGAPPTAPSQLAAATQSDTQVRLTWRDNSPNELDFRVELATGASFREIGAAAADSTAAVVAALTPATSYRFRIRACNSHGCSGYSNEAAATTPAAAPPPPPPPPPPPSPQPPGAAPAAPSHLTAEARSATEVEVRWRDRSGDEHDFRVEVWVGDGFQQVRSLPAGRTSTTLAHLEPAATYRLRVRACNGAGCSPYSNEAAATTLDPDAPTAVEVACEAARLEGLLARLEVLAPGGLGAGVNVYSTPMGNFAGIAYTGAGDRSPEAHLAFSSNLEETTLLRNPGRRQLATVSLARNQLNSDLVSPGSGDALHLLLNPTLDLADPDPLSLLAISNLVGDETAPLGNRPGRGLAALVQPCHGRLSERDAHALRVLAKLVRARATGAAGYEVALYRGQEAGSFRADVYPVAADGTGLGRMAVAIDVAFGPGDTLAGGTMRVLPACASPGDGGCTSVAAFTELLLVAPTVRGEVWRDSRYRVSTFGQASSGQAAAAIDWQDLLGGSTWLTPP